MIRWISEPRRREDVADDRLDLRTVLQVDLCDSFDECGIGRLNLADEEAPELPREPSRGERVHGQRVDQIDAVLIAVGLATCRNRSGAVWIHGKRERLGAGFV